MRQTSKNGVADIIAAHGAMGKTSAFASKYFDKPHNTYFTASFRISGTRRMFISIGKTYEAATRAEAIGKFIADSAPEIYNQAKLAAKFISGPEREAALREPGSLTSLLSYKEDVDGSFSLFDRKGVRVYPLTDGDSATTVDVEAEEIPFEPTPRRKVLSQTALNAFVTIDGMRIRSRDLEVMKAMRTLANANTASNMLFIGPSGAGKTSIPEAFAKASGMKFLRLNCAVVRDPEEWFGYREAQDASTVFVPTEFTKLVREGNAVIVMDEFNRVEGWLHNTLLPMLDHARRTVVHNEEIVVGNGVIFVATMNLGGRFTGTFLTDAAVMNRFDAIVHVDYLPFAEEASVLMERIGLSANDASTVVKIVSALRQLDKTADIGIDVSTRTALKIASLFKSSELPMIHIVEYAALATIEDPSIRKQAIDIITPVIRESEA